ncbi:MAG TPA: S-layer protein, partial [Methanoregula sp.]|nr:S-layer protein [Methanoregula sp.]
MRYIGIIIALSFLFAFTVMLVPPVHASEAPTVTITNYTVSPSVLMPDTLGTITVTIKNTAGTASVVEKSGKLAADDYSVVKTTDLTVNIENVHLEGNGVTVLTKDYASVGSIGPGQSIPVTFSFEAPSKSGLYYPEVWVDAKGGSSTKYPIPVNVNTALGIQKMAVLIMDSTLTGSQNPGDEIPVAVTVTNSGVMLASDVTLKIENVSAGTIAPKNADLYNLGSIPAGEKRTINIILLSDKKATAGLVKVPATIQYSTMNGAVQTQDTSIDILFKGKAELGFVSVDTSPARLTEGTPFDLTIRIENTGTGDAKQVSGRIDLPVEG